MLEKIKNKCIRNIKDTKGAISVAMVIFLLTMATAFSLIVDMSSTMFGMKEIQSKIDIAGMNALYNSVDYRYLRDESLGILNGGSISSSGTENNISSGNYTTVISDKYKDELSKIKYPGTKPEIRKSEVRFEYSTFGVGYNETTSTAAKSRPQVVLESIVSYQVSASTVSDAITRNLTKSVKSRYNNTDFSVTISDSGKDGKSTVMLHSITRIILE